MKPRMIMYVYNDITTDARVQRAANALADDFELTLISTQKGKSVIDKGYKNTLVGGYSHGAWGIIETLLASFRIIRKEQPDLVYCHDYYSAILAYLLIKTNYSGKIIYDAHELIIPEDGHTNKRIAFFYWFEKRVVKRVHLVICASEQRGVIMQNHYALPELPLVVPNISQLQVNDCDDDVKTILDSLKSFFTIRKLTVVYAGAVTGSRRLDKLIDAVVAASNQCKLLVVGSGGALEVLKKKADSHPALSCFFTGTIPYKCLGSVLSRCEIGYLYYPADTLNNKFCASNKVYEYASIGLPILANENPTIKQILNETAIGLAVDDIKQGLQRISCDCETYRRNCERFTANNKWEDVAQHLKKVVLAL